MRGNIERSIDIKRYIESLFRYWWMAVLLAGIFGILIGAFMYARDEKEYTQERDKISASIQIQEKVEVEERIEDAKSSLDMVEIQNVDLAVQYYRSIQQYTKYKDSSIYLSQNPYKVNRTALYYKISIENISNLSVDEQKVILGNIVLAYVQYINSGEMATKVAEELGMDSRYIDELITTNYQMGEAGITNCFNIYVINDEQCKGLSEKVKNCIDAYCDEFSGVIAKHSVEVVDEYNAIVMDSSISSAIDGVQTDIYNASNRLTNLKKTFSDEQLAYYNESIGVVDSKNEDEEIVESSVASLEEELAKLEPAQVQIKNVVLGVILGIVIHCCIILMYFVFTSKVLAESGYESMFGLRYLGKVTESEDDDRFGMLVVKIVLACKKNNIQKMALIGTDFGIVADNMVDELVSKLGEQDIETQRLEHVRSDCNELSTLFGIGKCLLVEHTGKTKIKDLEELVNICNDNDIDIYGVIDI